MRKHEENAFALARQLTALPQFKEVIYPGLDSHPQHKLATKQMTGFSGIVSVRMNADFEVIVRFLSNLKIFSLAESFGGVESLVNHPLSMTHASVPENLRAKIGIRHDLIRFSVGIEDAADLIEDIKQALEKCERG